MLMDIQLLCRKRGIAKELRGGPVARYIEQHLRVKPIVVGKQNKGNTDDECEVTT